MRLLKAIGKALLSFAGVFAFAGVVWVIKEFVPPYIIGFTALAVLFAGVTWAFYDGSEV
jgi:hypothetical protein